METLRRREGEDDDTNRPDLSVKEPNLRAPTDMDCSMSSVWYGRRDDMGADQ